LSFPGQLLEKDPRMIQGCQDQYNVIVGPYYRGMQLKLKEIWNSKHKLYYPSGASAEQIGNWFSLSEVYFETDFSRFDSSIHPELLLLELLIYERLGFNKNVIKVMRTNISAPLYCSKGVYLEVQGTRRSGTPNTGGGNSLINGCVFAFIMHKANIYSYKMIMLGDDNLLLINPKSENSNYVNERPTFQDSVEQLKQFGLRAVTKVSYGGEEFAVEFCSSKFWPLRDQYILGPKIGRTMAKFGWFIDPPMREKDCITMLKGTVISKYFDFSYLPVLRVMSQRILHLVEKQDVGKFELRPTHKALAEFSHEVTPEIYDFIQQHSGVTKEQLDEIENLIYEVVQLPAIINHPALQLLVEADL